VVKTFLHPARVQIVQRVSLPKLQQQKEDAERLGRDIGSFITRKDVGALTLPPSPGPPINSSRSTGIKNEL
jgi:hypothetical protein